MLKVIIGDYDITEKDILLKDFHPSTFLSSHMEDGMNFLMFGEDVGMTKKDMSWLKDNTKVPVTVILNNKNLIKGFKKSAKFSLTETIASDGTINPFDFAMQMIKQEDREYLVDFMVRNKVNLFIPVKLLSCNTNQLSITNQKNLQFLTRYMWSVAPEYLYHFIGHFFKLEPYVRFLKWKYPKKEEKKDA